VTGGAPAAGAAMAPPKAGTPIPILDESSRKQAFAALFNDELTTAQPKLKSAAGATSLNPIIELARTLGELRAIEMEAYGSAEQTKQHGAGLGERAHKMVEHAMNGMDKEVEEIWDDASRSRVNTNLRTGSRERQYGLHGLDSTQVNALKGIISTTEKLVPVARDLGAVTGDALLQSDAQAAQKLYDRATEVLKYDYANEGRDTSRSQPQPRQPQPLPPRGTGDVIRP
jgi:hypothetical protein